MSNKNKNQEIQEEAKYSRSEFLNILKNEAREYAKKFPSEGKKLDKTAWSGAYIKGERLKTYLNVPESTVDRNHIQNIVHYLGDQVFGYHKLSKDEVTENQINAAMTEAGISAGAEISADSINNFIKKLLGK